MTSPSPAPLTDAVSRMSEYDRERFFAKVSPPNQDGCMLWTASTSKDGYGRFSLFKKVRKAHRVAYELLVGPIEEGMEIDHVRERGCRSRACVNPDHLEPATRAVNNTRGGSPTAKNARKTKCIRGHLFTEENTAVDHLGGRHCRECARQRTHRRYVTRAGLKSPSSRTHCKSGHLLDSENTRITVDGSRRCRTCERKASRERRLRQSLSLPASKETPDER